MTSGTSPSGHSSHRSAAFLAKRPGAVEGRWEEMAGTSRWPSGRKPPGSTRWCRICVCKFPDSFGLDSCSKKSTPCHHPPSWPPTLYPKTNQGTPPAVQFWQERWSSEGALPAAQVPQRKSSMVGSKHCFHIFYFKDLGVKGCLLFFWMGLDEGDESNSSVFWATPCLCFRTQ